jgi:hypothetical protein
MPDPTQQGRAIVDTTYVRFDASGLMYWRDEFAESVTLGLQGSVGLAP